MRSFDVDLFGDVYVRDQARLRRHAVVTVGDGGQDWPPLYMILFEANHHQRVGRRFS